MGERFWLEERDPAELLRRAADLRRDGLLAVAMQLEDRARQLSKRTSE